MLEIITKITLLEWTLLGIALLALLFSVLAFLKANKAFLTAVSHSTSEAPVSAKPQKQIKQAVPEVCLNISAEQNEYGQIILLLKNTGRLAARSINLSISMPVRVFNAEDLSNGIEQADESGKSAILPRLTLLDAGSMLPIEEILCGKQFELPAVITMGYGKIADFPVSLLWQDETGREYRHEEIITL